MDEAEGLKKLTEYLKQTRRQAEIAIDNLNGQISALVQENERLTNAILSLQQERDHFKAQLENIQQFHSTKAIYKERDDWRALVSNIQSDNERLKEENDALQAQLREAHAEAQDLGKKLEFSEQERDHLTLQLEEVERTSRVDQNYKEPEADSSHREQVQLSPIALRDGKKIEFTPGTSEAVVRQLKFELKKAYEEIEENRIRAAEQLIVQKEEIKELRKQCADIKSIPPSPSVEPSPSAAPTTKNSSWFGGILGFVFPNNSSSNGESLNIFVV